MKMYTLFNEYGTVVSMYSDEDQAIADLDAAPANGWYIKPTDITINDIVEPILNENLVRELQVRVNACVAQYVNEVNEQGERDVYATKNGAQVEADFVVWYWEVLHDMCDDTSFGQITQKDYDNSGRYQL